VDAVWTAGSIRSTISRVIRSGVETIGDGMPPVFHELAELGDGVEAGDEAFDDGRELDDEVVRRGRFASRTSAWCELAVELTEELRRRRGPPDDRSPMFGVEQPSFLQQSPTGFVALRAKVRIQSRQVSSRPSAHKLGALVGTGLLQLCGGEDRSISLSCEYREPVTFNGNGCVHRTAADEADATVGEWNKSLRGLVAGLLGTRAMARGSPKRNAPVRWPSVSGWWRRSNRSSPMAQP
jgi:hypothetical protein